MLFHLAGHPSGQPQELVVTAAGQEAHFPFQAGTNPQNLGWEAEVFEFTAQGPQTTLEFYSDPDANTYPYGGPALDAVAVVPSDWLFL